MKKIAKFAKVKTPNKNAFVQFRIDHATIKILRKKDINIAESCREFLRDMAGVTTKAV